MGRQACGRIMCASAKDAGKMSIMLTGTLWEYRLCVVRSLCVLKHCGMFHPHSTNIFRVTLCIRATVCLRARTSHVSKPRTLNPKHKPLNPVYVLACMPLRFRAEKGAAVAAGTAGSCTNARQGPGPALHRNHMADGGT